jgi:hypothetical protein
LDYLAILSELESLVYFVQTAEFPDTIWFQLAICKELAHLEIHLFGKYVISGIGLGKVRSKTIVMVEN